MLRPKNKRKDSKKQVQPRLSISWPLWSSSWASTSASLAQQLQQHGFKGMVYLVEFVDQQDARLLIFQSAQ